jgi:NCS1 family nucleobase:cation symporter-1
VSDTSTFLNTWLVGYAILLGPIIGVVISDYWVVRRRQLDIDALYQAGAASIYWYQAGWNVRALIATIAGCVPCVPGFLAQVGVLASVAPVWRAAYDMSIFVGIAVASAVYCLLMRGVPGTHGAAEGGVHTVPRPGLA